MNQHFLWNFAWAPNTALPLATCTEQKEPGLKWEIRNFWQDNETIILHAFDPSLTDLAHYKHYYKEDSYYLLPDSNHNIKRRRNQLLYKPLLRQTDLAFGYGAKIILDPLQGIEKKAQVFTIKKEFFRYIVPTAPKIKMELARIEVRNTIYFSLCVEGKSLSRVKTIYKHLLDAHVSCDYVTFLKNRLK